MKRMMSGMSDSSVWDHVAFLRYLKLYTSSSIISSKAALSTSSFDNRIFVRFNEFNVQK